MTEDQPELTTRLQPPVAGGQRPWPAEEDRTQRVSPEGIFPPAPDAGAPGVTQRIAHPATAAGQAGRSGSLPGRSGPFPLPGQGSQSGPVAVAGQASQAGRVGQQSGPFPLPGQASQSGPFPVAGQAPPGPRSGPFPLPGQQFGQVPFGQPGQARLAQQGLAQPGQPGQAGRAALGQSREAPPGHLAQPGRLAGWGRRVAACLLDVAPVLLVVLAGGLVMIGSITAGMLIMGIGWLGGLVWVVLNRWIRGGGTGQSLGRRVLGIKLVGELSGAPIGAGRAFLRDLCHVADSAACCVGFLWPLWDGRGQTFADKIVKTVVVNARGK